MPEGTNNRTDERTASAETPNGVVVTQADRDALADHLNPERLPEPPGSWVYSIRNGDEDSYSILQLLARHRLAHTPTLRGEEVERLAQFLHDEGGFGDAMTDRTWPEHNGDTGQREGGWVKIVPSDVTAHFRDVARRWLLPRLAALSQPLAVDTGQSVPAGWKLVPIEPTPRMIAKGWGHSDLMVETATHSWRDEMRTAWSAMLAAAPAPSVSPDPAGEDFVRLPREQAQALLDNLNHRIEDAVEDGRSVSVPVFPGIAALEAALASSPIPKTFPREAGN